MTLTFGCIDNLISEYYINSAQRFSSKSKPLKNLRGNALWGLAGAENWRLSLFIHMLKKNA